MSIEIWQWRPVDSNGWYDWNPEKDPAWRAFVEDDAYVTRVLYIAPVVGEEDTERCESNSPQCGPVEHWDIEGVPLCTKCLESPQQQPTGRGAGVES